jgi:hypothetical protein
MGYIMTKEIKEFEEFLNNLLKDTILKFPENSKDKVEVKKTKLYYKFIARSCIYCFIAINDITNKSLGYVPAGSIMMPATFSRPAKHARGNIFKRETWEIACGEWGISYLR